MMHSLKYYTFGKAQGKSNNNWSRHNFSSKESEQMQPRKIMKTSRMFNEAQINAALKG